jgi:AraC-like DNA-binding protein/TolB-like protein
MNSTNHTEEQFLQKINEIIDANLHNENFGVAELAEQLGMSRATLHRRVKAVINKSVVEFIREARLNRALELLRNNEGTVSEIAYRAGFGSITYFNTIFHEHFGFTPGEVLKGLHPPVESVEVEPKPDQKPNLFKRRLFYIIIPIATVLLLTVYLLKPLKLPDTKENTIAILPFVNDSGEEFAPFTAWMGIEIGNKLSKIENMLVVPQSTTETYRDSKKSNRDIARELMVDHLLRGRTIKNGDKILLNIELIDANTGQSNLTEIYERGLDEAEEATLNRIFGICGDVVLQISDVLQTNLTSDEKEQVTKKSTENMAALRTYLEAKHYLDLSGINGHSNVRLAYEQFMKAKKLYENAVKTDSTFSDAYTMIGHIYVNRLPYHANIYLADRYLDTGKIYLVKALKFDKKNIEAASYLRQYYIRKGLLNEADKLLPLTENRIKNYTYYGGKLTEYRQLNDRYREAEAYLNYLETKPQDLPIMDYITNDAFYNFLSTGFPVRARELNEEILKSVRDTFLYLARKADWYITHGSKDSALVIYSQLQKKYPSSTTYLYYKVLFCNLNRDFTKALETGLILEEKLLSRAGSVSPDFRVAGYTYLKNGMKEKADYHFKGSIKRAEDEIKLNSINARSYTSHFNLALIYAILNDKQKSLQYLEMIKKSPSVPLNFINDLKTNPMFDNVRNEAEFQKISSELEKKYLEEHEKIKKLLIRHGLEPA